MTVTDTPAGPFVRVPTCVLGWAENPGRGWVTTPVENMTPDPWTWLAALSTAVAAGTPPDVAWVALPAPRAHTVANEPDPIPPPADSPGLGCGESGPTQESDPHGEVQSEPR